MCTYYLLHPSSLGWIAALGGERGIRWASLNPEPGGLLKELNQRLALGREAIPALTQWQDWLQRADEQPFPLAWRNALRAAVEDPRAVDSVALDLEGTTFQLAVWDELQKIPLGSLLSYGQLALRIGRPRAVRAVGSACGANPIPLLVPCHRVIASRGQPGGFGLGLAVKRALLEREGVSWTALAEYQIAD